jgi:8-oxo-dGTP pyrophosphatase MutT (NUDIX family)
MIPPHNPIDTISVEAIANCLRQFSPVGNDIIQQNGLVKAAVLVPLFRQENRWHLLFTRRTDRLANHKGQVAFPGGARDPGDRDEIDTAMRETYEEIGMTANCIRVLGKMPVFPTVSGFAITPVVSLVCWPVDLHPAELEVERIFSVPISWLAEPGNAEQRLYTRSNGSSDLVWFFQPFGGEVIWGVTAQIVVDLMKILGIKK